MKILTRMSAVLITILFISCSEEKEQVLQIEGEVVNTNTESILLIKPAQDMRFDSIIEIPVVNGKFSFETKLQHPQAVNLFLGEARDNGGGRLMPLFLENEKIRLTIHPEEDFDKNIVDGGELNAQYLKYVQESDRKFKPRLQPLQDNTDLLIQNEEYNSEKMNLLYAELRKAETQDQKIVIYNKIDELREAGIHLSPRAEALEKKIAPLRQEKQEWQEQYITNNPSLVSYSFLLNELQYNKAGIDIAWAANAQKILSEAHPGHPYNELSSNLLNAIVNVKVGKEFTDFSAPDLQGNTVRLSEEIAGKMTLLDLWATWCGPCIAKTRTMVPIYEEYKDKGFTIVGVAGEFRNTERLEKFLEKEKWPWLNLVELDRENAIWEKYGVDGGGGGIFLIDEKGKILAKDPTAEEVRLALERRYNSVSMIN